MSGLKQYCGIYGATLVLLTACAVAFNWVVDPFDVYRAVKKQGFNAHKATYGNYARLAKPIQVERFPRPGIALGNSRTQFGVDMSHPFWGGKGGWNLSVNAAGIFEIGHLLRHAVTVAPVEKAVIGVDFLMFFNAKMFKDDSYLAVDADGKPNPFHRLRQHALSLMTGDALLASARTLRKQKPMDDKFALDGRMRSDRERKKTLEDDGFHAQFVKIEGEFMQAIHRAVRSHGFHYGSVKGASSLDALKALLEFAVDRKVKVYLIVSPCHARLWELYDALGVWPQFEQWKRDITAIVDAVNRLNPGNPVELWDFSGYGPFNVEPVPSPAQRDSVMRWYLDPSHYSVELGNIMLDRLDRPPPGDAEPVFGYRLTAARVEGVLADIRRRREAFRAAFPAVSREVRDNVARFIARARDDEPRRDGGRNFLF